MHRNVPDDVRYRLLSYLAEHPDATQREVAERLGISIGKANYCLRAVIEKGWVKMRNFHNSKKKAAYLYVLTPKGLEEKINITFAFLRRKRAEYDLLAEEIHRLTEEVRRIGGAPSEHSA